MYYGLPDFPPLYAPVGWWRSYVALRLGGKDRQRAIYGSNNESSLKVRDWMRFCVTGGKTLSVPVEGGASALKNRPSVSWVTAREAEHESRRIVSTLSTLYGRTPYYNLLKSEIIESVDFTQSIKASAVCTRAFLNIDSILGLGDETLLEALRDKINHGEELLCKIAKEFDNKILTRVEPRISIIDSLFRLGPDAIFTLLPAF